MQRGWNIVFAGAWGASLWQDDNSQAWRLRFFDGHCGNVLPMQFGREKDASAARDAIKHFADWESISMEEARSVFVERQSELRRAILEAMQW